ncbi:MAG: molybdopterin molybdotransferase MoeA, partial [Pseudomonadota bacterium]
MSLSRLVPADEALRIVLGGVTACGIEEVSLAQAAGRTVSQDLEARRTQPPFDASAMDGYAVRQADILSLPAILNVVGHSRAGMPYGSGVGDQQAVRIFTGAVVPPGADSIIIQENTKATDDGRVRVLKGVEPGRFIRPAGLDFTSGEVLIHAGELLGPSRLALAASMNHAKITVFRKPRVALITTGDELVMPGGETGAGQIIASNTFGLMASIENCGGVVIDCGIVEDTREALQTAFEKATASGADLIVTTGGASVGDHDLVLPVAQETGFDFRISKIAMR